MGVNGNVRVLTGCVLQVGSKNRNMIDCDSLVASLNICSGWQLCMQDT